jgi:hypothetical protein
MEQHHDTAYAAVLKTAVAILGWFASMTLADIQTVLGIISALVVTGYSLTQWWVLWRDKVAKRPPGGGAFGKTGPAPLGKD